MADDFDDSSYGYDCAETDKAQRRVLESETERLQRELEEAKADKSSVEASLKTAWDRGVALTAQVSSLTTEIEKYKQLYDLETAHGRDTAATINKTLEDTRAQVSSLRAFVEKAPHELGCPRYQSCACPTCSSNRNKIYGCNCWKKAALEGQSDAK